MKESNGSMGEKNKKSDIKKKPEINNSHAPENSYYNIEMEDKAGKYLPTSKDEYYNVEVAPKDQMKNHSTPQPRGTAESQYASLDANRYSGHIYTGFKIWPFCRCLVI